ncbi:MAG: hypothetical protein COB22_04220 [Cycloclasticus sp.]|nr:MAG: hypothetical protein COB22_04220 [Cycloclasticus sp.]
MAELRPSVLYALLVFGAILAGLGLIFGLFYDTEKLEGNRYLNSYAEFNGVTLTEKQKKAVSLLQNSDVEWAHFRFIEAIKNDDLSLVNAFIDADMPLNSNSILLEIALGKSLDKKTLLMLLRANYALNLDALYRLPNYVTEFDEQLSAVSKPYSEAKKEQYRLAMMEYKKKFIKWEEALEEKKQHLLRACSNDACRSGRINDARLLYEDSEPVEPKLDYIARERVYVSLFTIFVWQKDRLLIKFIQQQGAELMANKLFLTDAKLIYFMVDVEGNSTIINTKQQ